MLVTGFFTKDKSILSFITVIIFASSVVGIFFTWVNQHYTEPVVLFNGMIRSDDFAAYFKLLFDIAGILTVLVAWPSEYYALIIAAVTGAHLLAMSINFIMVFISLELISLCSYALAGFAFTKHASEGSFKYFLFGSVASAFMLYGFSLIYGVTGHLDFSSGTFAQILMSSHSSLLLAGVLMALTGFLYKIGAAPLHPWVPDVYEAAPMPVVAFFSVVPKLAGLAILTRFVLALAPFDHRGYQGQLAIGIVALLSLTVGNFSALWQKRPKRLMAYSSIAQSGFLLVGLTSFSIQGVHFMLFYATVYMIMNFLVFLYLQYFESAGIYSLESFAGTGKTFLVPSIFLLVGLIALTGLPPTAGFTAKLFVFTSLWESYQQSNQPILVWLLVFGLLNTVVALFYYIRIPYYAFVKPPSRNTKANILLWENLFGLILVLIVVLLFFNPGLLMGWINKINFVL
jgi:NADH-quinone oxidoreductase subunit N